MTNPVKIALYNHKGGVGKTTLTVNLGFALAELGKKVLLVDSDPQTNLTSYLVEDEVVDDFLDSSDLESGRTVWSAVKPIHDGEGAPRIVRPVERQENLYLIPGDIRLSEFESDLNDYWIKCIEGRNLGFRGTAALSQVVSEVANSISADYVFYDAGPNIGPLNRAILLDCDYFIIPVACDLFSVRALRTLGRTLSEWVQRWNVISSLAPSESYLLRGLPKFMGYIPQGFRVYGGQMSKRHAQYHDRIKKDIQSQIVKILQRANTSLATGSMSKHQLGQVKDFGNMVPLSQDAGTALWNLSGISRERRDEAHNVFLEIASEIVSRSTGS